MPLPQRDVHCPVVAVAFAALSYLYYYVAVIIAGGALGWTKEEGEAVMKCINAWLPMGPPRDAAPESKCIPAARELSPTWAQRERAREAVRRTATA